MISMQTLKMIKIYDELTSETSMFQWCFNDDWWFANDSVAKEIHTAENEQGLAASVVSQTFLQETYVPTFFSIIQGSDPGK